MTTTTTIDGNVDEFLGTWACTNPCHLCSESFDLLRISPQSSSSVTSWYDIITMESELFSLPLPSSSLLMTMILASTHDVLSSYIPTPPPPSYSLFQYQSSPELWHAEFSSHSKGEQHFSPGWPRATQVAVKFWSSCGRCHKFMVLLDRCGIVNVMFCVFIL